MHHRTHINLLNLLLSLSDALDLGSPDLSQHQLRTAYIAWEIGRKAGLSEKDEITLFIASLLHDVGALTPEEKLDINQKDDQYPQRHCILGEKFLSRVRLFKPSAKLISYHHSNWTEISDSLSPALARSTQILMLADKIERRIDRQTFILHQDREIIEFAQSLSGDIVKPEIVALFLKVSDCENFWLDLTSTRLYSLLLHNAPGKNVEIDMSYLLEISQLFRDMIDFRSKFTSTHSSGVASTAAALSRLFGFTEQEIQFMEVAGNFHDLGKLVIPDSILTKPGKLTDEEYALIRQHTYYTYHILETIGGIQQITEWAAFHHEHLDGSGYPFHITANELSIKSRIMAVADIFTALAEERPYRKAMEKDDIMKILLDYSDRNWLDRSIVDLLYKNYDEVEGYTRKVQQETKKYYERMFSIS